MHFPSSGDGVQLSFPGLSAAWMLQSSVHGRIHSVSREAIPRWRPVAKRLLNAARQWDGNIDHNYVINAGSQEKPVVRGCRQQTGDQA